MIGTVSADGALEFYYQHINDERTIRCGKCYSTPEMLEDGRIRLHETWQWLDDDASSGTSVVEEIRQ